MQIALLPALSTEEKQRLKRWLEMVLASPRLVQTGTGSANNFPLTAKIAVYVNGHPLIIQNTGQWQSYDNRILYIGQESTLMGLGERLGILAAIISVSGLWGDLTDAYSAAVSRSLLESYNTAMQGIIRMSGRGEATGLAFSEDRAQVAAQIDGAWYLPGGEAIEVDNTWTIVQ